MSTIKLTRESLLAALHPSDRAAVLRTIMAPETSRQYRWKWNCG